MKNKVYKKIFDKIFSLENEVTSITGGDSLDRLLWFLLGYIDALRENCDVPITFMSEFSNFAMDEMRVNQARSKGWQYYFRILHPSEKKAVVAFFEMMHRFFFMVNE